MSDASDRFPMSKRGKVIVGGGTLAAALALAVPLIAGFEGKRNVGYADPAPAGYATICYGHKQIGVIGKYMTDAQCVALLNADAARHGVDIAACLPANLPSESLGAFISIGFNLGSPAFCKSSMARDARAGKLAQACADLSKYVWAGNRQLPGLIRRRASERALCEKGLK